MKILTQGQYYGEKKLEVKIPGIFLSEYDYLIPQTDWHYHENPYFMYLLRGKLYDINKKRESRCSTGSLVFLNWQETHFNKKESEKARGFHIEFQRDWFEQNKLNLELWEGSQLIENPRAHHLLGKIYFEFCLSDNLSQVSIELLLLQLCENIEQVLTNKEKQPEWIETLKEILHASSNHSNYSLNDLAAEVGVHPVHISRSVPKYLSSSLGDYVRQGKIKKALKLMMHGDNSLSEISYLCGFSDQSHFTRTFKIYMGITPGEFRRKCG